MTIDTIVYDPEGPDTGRETITLTNANARNYATGELWLQVGDRSTKTRISGSLSGSEQRTFTANFRFPNTDTCVLLMHEQQVLDSYCYYLPRSSSSGG